MSIRDIVEVNITRETPVAGIDTFDVMLFVSDETYLPVRRQSFTSLSSVANVYPKGSVGYKVAESYFSNNPRPQTIIFGRRLTDLVEVNIDEANDGEVYSLLIDGDTVSYTAGSTDTVSDISDALTTEIQGLGGNIAASDQAGAIDVTNVDSSVIFSISIVSGKMSFTPIVFTETITETLNAILDLDDDFYGISLETKDTTDLDSVISFCNTNKKLLGLTLDEGDILDPLDSTDYFTEKKDAEVDRAFGCYHAVEGEYVETGLFGNLFPNFPGSATFAFKSAGTSPVSNLSLDDRTTVLSKGGNTYERRASNNIFYNGQTFVGLPIDIIIAIDWLESDISTRVFSTLNNKPKVTYTEPGISVLEADVRAGLTQGVDEGLIVNFTISRVARNDVPAADRTARRYDGLSFVAELAGSIINVTINGTVTF